MYFLKGCKFWWSPSHLPQKFIIDHCIRKNAAPDVDKNKITSKHFNVRLVAQPRNEGDKTNTGSNVSAAARSVQY